jgi:uncharacterized protein YrrD
MKDFDFNIGAQVICTDGQCGKLLKVVVPDEEILTDLIVEKGFLQAEDRVVPVETVERVTEDEIHLSISSDELTTFEAHKERTFRVPEPEWRGRGGEAYQEGEAVTRTARSHGLALTGPMVPMVRKRVQEGISPTETVVERGTEVRTPLTSIGHVDHVLVDPDSGAIRHVVVDRGLIAPSVVVPADAIEEVGPEAVIIALEEDEIDELPKYQPPGEATVLLEFEERLKEAAPDFSEVEAVFEGGILQPSGVVPDVASKRRAEATARSVEGIVDVENALDTDTAITARTRAALADDPRTELADVNVASDRGIVTLTGRVDDKAVRKTAEEIAEAQRGVVEVINDLEIEEDEFTPWLKGRHPEGPAFKHRP